MNEQLTNNLQNKNMQTPEVQLPLIDLRIDDTLFDSVKLGSETLVVISKERNVLPRLCRRLGFEACKEACGLTKEERKALSIEDRSCAQGNLENAIVELGIRQSDIYLGQVVGGTEVMFIDEHMPGDEIVALPKTDAVFGYEDTVKACRLADCGLVVVRGTDSNGRKFNGFIHATRNNMNGDDQFEYEGQPVGGVEKMLKQVVAHYQPQEISVDLVSGIRQDLYTFNFNPSEKELTENPNDTPDFKRERMFKGWLAQGWISQHLDESGNWDGISWDVDMYAAVKHQVERAGLGDVYDDSKAIVDGDTDSGHASNRFGKLGKIPEARDLYLVLPINYSRSK